jgi:L-cysteine:1D-myo-inositol 2-amino-2-deoxy-alpha-D-glucopyranoside ligase
VKLYNTHSKELEEFLPHGEVVTIYVCGITPYDTTHLRHAFTYTSADVLIRYLESKRLSVKYVQNVTDIDDDILRKANEVGEDWLAVGNRWTVHFIEDMQALNVRAPDFFPRATDAIPEIITWVQKLLESGVAYEAGGSVYYEVNAWETFGELCSIPREEMLPIANERGNHPDDPAKRDPLDFVLWQAKAQGEPAWGSPWGEGRPGWHIECSTLSTKYLGETIDIHSGGADLCFPHHECEIAQVEPVTKEHPFVRIWMHTAMVYHDGEKMSKSLGNLVWVRDLLKTFMPDAIRLYLGKHHYREEWSYSEEELKVAEEEVKLIQDALNMEGGGENSLSVDSQREKFRTAMENDLDTPTAVNAIVNLAMEILSSTDQELNIEEAQGFLWEMGRIFGLRLGTKLNKLVEKRWRKHAGRFGG